MSWPDILGSKSIALTILIDKALSHNIEYNVFNIKALENNLPDSNMIDRIIYYQIYQFQIMNSKLLFCILEGDLKW